jgi:hypothetical protein
MDRSMLYAIVALSLGATASMAALWGGISRKRSLSSPKALEAPYGVRSPDAEAVPSRYRWNQPRPGKDKGVSPAPLDATASKHSRKAKQKNRKKRGY